MRKMLKMSVAAAMVMGISSVSAQANDGTDIISNVKVKGEIRARYEMVDDNTNKDANAFTNRLTIGASADLLGTDWLSAYAEMTNVSNLNDNYNSTNNGETSYAKVFDPEQTRLTQSYLDVKIDKTLIRYGRQMINLDNQRFVGAVGWRQMPQTFDALLVANNAVKNLNLAAVYVTQVNRIFADDAASSLDTRTLILNASYKVMPELKVTAYSYMIGAGTAGTNTTNGVGSDTYGVALTGKVAASDSLKLNYRVEYATQTNPTMENSGNTSTSDVNANYYNLNVGVNANGILAGLGYELLGSNSGVNAFSTPLATLHGKNGWADKFLGTPDDGLADTSLMIGYKAKGFGVAKVIYHDFSSDVGSTDYGTEIDAVYKNKIPGVNNLTGLVKVASFNADSASYTDTTKFWLMLDYKFASK